jgi:hypothetical protein
MGEYKNTIEQGYQTYVNEYPDYSAFNISDYDHPFQESVLGDSVGFVGYNESDLERACLVESRNDVPEVANLPMDDLAWLPIGVTRILKIQRVPDHDALWIEAAKILEQLNSSEQLLPEKLMRNIMTIIRAVLASTWTTNDHDSDDWSTSTNQNSVLQEASVLARYMAFPTVEGVVKSLCLHDIKMSGDVRPGRRVLCYSGSDYLGDDGDEVNDLGHLLWHLEQDAAEEPLQTRMKEFRAAVEDFFRISASDDIGAYGYFSNRRNTTLHGEARARAESGILLNLLSLLILNIDHIPKHRRNPS